MLYQGLLLMALLACGLVASLEPPPHPPPPSWPHHQPHLHTHQHTQPCSVHSRTPHTPALPPVYTQPHYGLQVPGSNMVTSAAQKAKDTSKSAANSVSQSMVSKTGKVRGAGLKVGR